jgi:hypothetical protein
VFVTKGELVVGDIDAISSYIGLWKMFLHSYDAQMFLSLTTVREF